MLIDSHVHLNDSEYAQSLPDILQEMRAVGVKAAVVPGTDVPTSQSAVALALRYPCLLPAVGIHPHEADSCCAASMKEIAILARQAIAIGEIGLDYHYNFASRESQLTCFEANLDLAIQMNLPVIIHSREADHDILSILHRCGLPRAKGVVHCCSSNWATASEYLDMGLYIGITGMVTYKKMTEVHEIATRCMSGRLLVETDGPYLAPVPNRGKVCHPAWVTDTCRAISVLRQETFEETCRHTTDAAITLFGDKLEEAANSVISFTK